ncbi:MAG: hypothetical protein RBU37_11080 [Myxococcota bacterium]|jgi:hypothetical protein|nr:hypothetical protein [Myxococcota bacterium]
MSEPLKERKRGEPLEERRRGEPLEERRRGEPLEEREPNVSIRKKKRVFVNWALVLFPRLFKGAFC